MADNVSTGLQQKEDLQQNQPSIVYTENQQKSLAFYMERCKVAKNQRDQIYKDFDDTTFQIDYELNEQAKNSYLRKKKNDDEVRINTGTTEKKIEAVQNELLSMNMQPELQVFDMDDNELKDLATEMTDVVTRTNEIEKDDDFWIEATQELLCQRAVFVEENWVDKTVKDKRRIKGELGKIGFSFASTDNRIQRAEKRVLSGLQVYLGDVSIPAYRFNEQPYILKYDRVHYDTARQIFGKWKNWKYVRPGMGDNAWYGGSYKWRFSILKQHEVEIIHYMSYPDDEYQIIINGVMMLDVASPLPWEREGYNMTMTVLKPMRRDFAYGKPLTASAKTLQALDNETIRLMIRKFRQALEPPLGTTGTIYSKDIWSPGAVTQGVSKDNFSKLIDHDGLNQSEFMLYDLINKKTEEFIGANNVMQGVQANRKQTATEIMTMYRQAMKMLGFAVLGFVRMKRDATYLRLDSIFENYLDPVKKVKNELTGEIEEVYRKFTVSNGNLGGEKRGKKVIQFMGRDLTPEEEQQIYDYENEQEELGNPIRIKTVNVKKLRDIALQFFVTVTPHEKESSALHKVMFEDYMQQAVGISQVIQRPLNPDRVIDEFERTWNKKDMFQKAAPQGMMPGMEGMDGEVQSQAKDMMAELDKMSSGMGGQMKMGEASRPKQPSLNTLGTGTAPV